MSKKVRTADDVAIVVACDKPDKPSIRKLVKPLASQGVWVKFGLVPILGTSLPFLAGLASQYGFKTFLDTKLADIPNTLAEATKVAAKYGYGFDAINVHASSGLESMKAVVANKGKMLVFAVTVLTSIDEGECVSIFGDTPGKKVLQFAFAAHEAGVDGIICSSREGEMLRKVTELSDLLIWTPGIRPVDAPPDDQSRTMTAGEAALFADGLVIGRPITGSASPPASVEVFRSEIADSLAAKAQADLEASWPVYVLTYYSPYEFDGGGIVHELCWSHDHKYEFHAANDKMARQIAQEFIDDPEGVVVVGRERAKREMSNLTRKL